MLLHNRFVLLYLGDFRPPLNFMTLVVEALGKEFGATDISVNFLPKKSTSLDKIVGHVTMLSAAPSTSI